MPCVGKDKKMTYTGTMVLPRNAVRMTEDEMNYTEGGGRLWVSDASVKKVVAYLKNGMLGSVTSILGISPTVLGKAIGLVGAVLGYYSLIGDALDFVNKHDGVSGGMWLGYPSYHM
jgi:hypothetical protein